MLGEEESTRPEWAAFLRAVSETYYGADDDRALLERSLDLSSTELTNANEKIEQKVVERTRQLGEEQARLRSAINSLDVGLLMTFQDDQTISYNTMLPQIFGFNQTANEPAEHQPELTLATLENKLLPSKFSLLGAIENCQHTGKDFEVSAITYGNPDSECFRRTN